MTYQDIEQLRRSIGEKLDAPCGHEADELPGHLQVHIKQKSLKDDGVTYQKCNLSGTGRRIIRKKIGGN